MSNQSVLSMTLQLSQTADKKREWWGGGSSCTATFRDQQEHVVKREKQNTERES